MQFRYSLRTRSWTKKGTTNKQQIRIRTKKKSNNYDFKEDIDQNHNYEEGAVLNQKKKKQEILKNISKFEKLQSFLYFFIFLFTRNSRTHFFF